MAKQLIPFLIAISGRKPTQAEAEAVANRLRNSGLHRERRHRIMQMDLDELGKQHYNMTLTGDGVLCDFKYVILVGRKRRKR